MPTGAINHLESLLPEDKKRYFQKLTIRGETLPDPFEIEEKRWENAIQKWPSVQYGDIWRYLIDTPGMYTEESMKAYKSLDGYNFFVSGHVQQVLYSCASDSVCYLKSIVIPSQKVTDKKQWHRCWLAVEKSSRNNGTVLAAHCTCKAGLGEACSHIAAVLFKVEAAFKLNLNCPSKTSTACVWNQFYREKVTPVPASDICFDRPCHDRAGPPKRRRVTVTVDTDSDEDDEAALRKLKSICPKACILTKDDSDTDTASDDDEMPPILTREMSENLETLSKDEILETCRRFVKDFEVSGNQASNLEKMTRAQSECALWKRQRVGRITASFAHDIKVMRPSTSPASTIKRIMQYDTTDLSHLKSVAFGLKHERDAKQKFKAIGTQLHKNFVLRDCGLVIDTTFPVFAASPDGVRQCDCHGEGLIEVKCSYKHRDANVSAIPHLDSDFYLESDTLKLKVGHRYYTQVQFQMYVCNRTFCDFIVYTNKDIHFQTIVYNPEFVAEMITKCTKFAFDHLIPEIIGKKLKNLHDQSH